MLDKYVGKSIQITTEYNGHIGVLLDYSPVGVLVKLTNVDGSSSGYREGDTVFFSYTNLRFKILR